MRWNFTFGPSAKVKLGSAVFKGPKTCWLLVLDVSSVKATDRKSFDEVKFDLSPFNVKLWWRIFKMTKTSWLFVLEVLNVKVIYRKTYPANLLLRSNFTFDRPINVKLLWIFMSDGISIWHIVVYLGQEKLICIDEFYYTLNLESILSNLCLKICIEQGKQYLQTCLLLLFKKGSYIFKRHFHEVDDVIWTGVCFAQINTHYVLNCQHKNQ